MQEWPNTIAANMELLVDKASATKKMLCVILRRNHVGAVEPEHSDKRPKRQRIEDKEQLGCCSYMAASGDIDVCMPLNQTQHINVPSACYARLEFQRSLQAPGCYDLGSLQIYFKASSLSAFVTDLSPWKATPLLVIQLM